MTLLDFLLKNPVIEVDSTKIVAALMGISNTRAHKLLEQGAVEASRNKAKVQIGTNDYFLKNDIVRVGKGRFYNL